MILCTKCKTENMSIATFCIKCGEKLQAPFSFELPEILSFTPEDKEYQQYAKLQKFLYRYDVYTKSCHSCIHSDSYNPDISTKCALYQVYPYRVLGLTEIQAKKAVHLPYCNRFQSCGTICPKCQVYVNPQPKYEYETKKRLLGGKRITHTTRHCPICDELLLRDPVQIKKIDIPEWAVVGMIVLFVVSGAFLIAALLGGV